MNVSLAAIPLDNNTLILLVLVAASAISSWVQNWRKRTAEKSRGEHPAPPPRPRESLPEQPSMEEILRRLLGGEPPVETPAPPASPPPLAGTRRGELPPLVGSREDQPEPEMSWREETQLPPSPPRAKPAMESVPRRTSKPPAMPAAKPAAAPMHPSSGSSIPHLERLGVPPPHSTVITRGHRRRSSVGDRAIAQVRNPRAVRQAFVASLVFGPPKSLESPQP